jgi:hypothetical protein
MTISPNIVYAIKVNQNEKEVLRVLRILFAHGYVFERDERLRTIESFQKEYNTTGRCNGDRFYYWHWLVLNYDKECKAVVMAFSEFLSGFVEIKIENLFNNEKV